jgi:hypothetical protein
LSEVRQWLQLVGRSGGAGLPGDLSASGPDVSWPSLLFRAGRIRAWPGERLGNADLADGESISGRVGANCDDSL